jgi:hypothetical protein
MKIMYWIALLVTALGFSTVATAEQATGPEAFYGRYNGTAQAIDVQGWPVGVDRRDFDVEIGQADNGFFVAWTTVRKSSGKGVRRDSTRIVFEPSGRAGIYIQKAAASELANSFSWASISARALTVRVLGILDDGGYEIQTYERTLAKDGLQLFFRSDRNGSGSKIVTAFSRRQTK